MDEMQFYRQCTKYYYYPSRGKYSVNVKILEWYLHCKVPEDLKKLFKTNFFFGFGYTSWNKITNDKNLNELYQQSGGRHTIELDESSLITREVVTSIRIFKVLILPKIHFYELHSMEVKNLYVFAYTFI
jgi:hypothetical protein